MRFNKYGLESDRQANCRDLPRASLATLLAVAGNLQLTVEVGLESNCDRTSRTRPAFITGGLIYSVRDNIDLDLGVKRGLNEPATDLTLLAGFSMHFRNITKLQQITPDCRAVAGLGKCCRDGSKRGCAARQRESISKQRTPALTGILFDML